MDALVPLEAVVAGGGGLESPSSAFIGVCEGKMGKKGPTVEAEASRHTTAYRSSKQLAPSTVVASSL